MAVANDRSMNAELKLGAVDHTIRLAVGQDRGGLVDKRHDDLRRNLTGSAYLDGDHHVEEYLAGLIRP